MTNENIKQLEQELTTIEDLTLNETATEAVKGGPAYMKLGDIKGEATQADHKEWIIIESMSSPIYR